MAEKRMRQQNNTPRTGARSLRFRIMRLVIPVVMGTFLIFSILGVIGVRGSGQTSLQREHRENLGSLVSVTNNRFEQIANDLRLITNNSDTRTFARDTLISLSGESLEASQRSLLTNFTNELQQHPGSYVAIRYVTYTGSVWSEAVSYTGSTPVLDASISLNEMVNDPTLARALASMLGQVTVGDIDFVDREGRFFQEGGFPFIRFSAPVASENDVTTITGVIQLDVAAGSLLNSLQTEIEQLSEGQDARRVLLIDRAGNAIIDSSVPLETMTSQLARSATASITDAYPQLASYLEAQRSPTNINQNNPLTNEAVEIGTHIISTAEIGFSLMGSSYWRLLLIDDASLVQNYVNNLALLIVAGSLLVGAIICAVIYVILGYSLRPVSSLARQWTEQASVVSSGSTARLTAADVVDTSNSYDEVDQLVGAFQTVAQRVDELHDELELQTGRYARNLDITARIGHETAALHDIDQLLNRAVDLICEEFGFDHAQVFLIDDIGKNAILVYSYGQAGKALLGQKHSLLIGSPSAVGEVTALGKAVIVNDARQLTDAQRADSLLPQTLTQVVLPMQVGTSIIGALDIQSAQPHGFRQQELGTFQLLADQIAIAVQNARLLLQSEERVQQIDTLNRQLTRGAWESAETHTADSVYRYDLLKVERGEDADSTPADADDRALRVPITIRGQVIGMLDALPEERGFSQNDQIIMRAVADRVAIAIESARLFEETQSSLAETSTLYQLSRYLGEAETLEDIIRAIVTSVMPDAAGGQIGVFEDYPFEAAPEWIEIATDWMLHDSGHKEVQLNGMRLRTADHALLRDMNPNQVTLVSDAERDQRLDEVFRAVLEDIGARAMVLIPFSVRSVWRGVIFIQFADAREFSDREGRIYTALIDQAGIAIDNRMLLQQNEIALTQIERLYSASRIVNMSQTMQDLITAAVTTSRDAGLNFELAMFEGELDEMGWPTRLRLAAYSRYGEEHTADEVYAVEIPAASPLRARDPQIVVDRPEETSPLVGYIRARGYYYGVVFPLFSANQPIALFFIVANEVRDLSTEDYEVYRALTGQMSTVLQNRRLLEQTEEALDETRRLYAASRAITSAVHVEGIYEAAAQYLVVPTVSTHRVSILMARPSPTPEAPYVECDYLWNRGIETNVKSHTQILAEDVPLARLLRASDDHLSYPDLKHDAPESEPLAELLARNGSSSAVLTSIRTRQRWFGVLMVESDRAYTMDDQYVRFTQALADQMAVALEGLLLFHEAQAQAQRALALAEVGQLASRIGGDFANSINEVLMRVAEAADYDRWSLTLLDASGSRLERVVYNSPEIEQPQIGGDRFFELTSGRPVVEAFHANRQLLINDPASFPAYLNTADEEIERIGKRLVSPVRIGNRPVGVLIVGRSLSAPDLDENDEQLVQTLAAQVSVAVENRRLFRAAEGERERLRSILATLPAGVLVLDAQTFLPVQNNDQAEQLLGHAIDPDVPFSAERYHIYRSGTEALYPEEDLPIRIAALTGSQEVSDDIAILQPGGDEVDLLVNAAPILDASGTVTAVVAAFQDITALRSLETSLQQNLHETIALYEMTRSFSEAEETSDVIAEIANQFGALEATDIYVVMFDEQTQRHSSVYSLRSDEVAFPLPESLLRQDASQFAGTLAEANLASDEVQRLSDKGVAAYASLLLRSRTRRAPLGWVLLAYETAQEFSADRVQFLTTLNDTASVALDNRFLFRSTEDALQETALLYGAATEISRVRDPQEFQAALQNALAAHSPDIAAAYLKMDGSLTELFKADLDGAAVSFADLIAKHHLLESRQSIVIDDLHAAAEPTAFERDLLALGNIRALALVHLRAQGEGGGCLIVAYHQPHQFSSSDTRYLNAVADSASVVFDNILLLSQIQSTLQETSVLYQASRALSDTDTAEGVLEIATHFLAERPNSTAFVALLKGGQWSQEGALVHIASSWHSSASGLELAGVSLSPEQYPAWRLLATPEVLTINDVQSADLTPAEAAGIAGFELRSVGVLPLRVSGRALGAIVLGSREPYQHSERDLRIYRSFAEQASLRMEAARLLTQTERRARQLATSAQVSQIASSILDLDELMPRIVDLIREAFGYDHAQIFLMDDQEDYAELRASTGDAGKQLIAIRHRLQKGSHSVIGQVTATGEPVTAFDTSDARVVHRPNPYLPQTRSEMALPLILKGKVVGALDVQSNQPSAFDDDDVAVLTTLAAQISVAIDNANLFQQSRRRANEMSFLFGVTTAAAAAETLTDALQNVAGELGESLEALSVSMYLPEIYMDAQENVIVRMRPVALVGTEQPLSELSEVDVDDPQNMIAASARDRQPVIIGNLASEPRYLPVADEARSAILVPLVSGAQLVGLVAVESEKTNAYDKDTLTLLLTLSGTLSAIVQNQQLLEQVQQTNEQLRELDRIKSDFLANMSHELRTPLNSIIGFSRVILKGIDGPLTEMQEQDLSTIYTSGLHLLNLINDILDQAKIAAGKLDLQLGFFEMKAVVDGVRSIGIGLVKDKPIDIYVDIAPGLPQAYGDEFRTRQVMLNLVSNAAKFTREGSITIRSYLATDPNTGMRMVCTDVIDTGIGIEEKDIPLLFEAFRQVDSSLTRTVGGTGLGLPIAKSLVEMQGGTMTVRSQVNVGSTFTITVPTEITDGDEDEPKQTLAFEPPQTEAKNAPVNGKEDTAVFEKNEQPRIPAQHLKRQILLIEDNPDMVDQLRRSLQREGFDIYNASIPLEAEAMASGLHPTLIVMDVNFSKGAGWEILERLKRRDDTSDIPVIVISLSEDVERARKLGVLHFIRRPFMPDDLITAVRAAEHESRVDRILIIDDQPESVRLLHQMLDEQGEYRVFSATNGMDGISMVARRRPSLVIVDLRMPEMDGFQVIQELRGNPETTNIPIIVVTGDTLNEEELSRLQHLKVLYKFEMETEQYRTVLEEIRHRQDNGGGGSMNGA